MTLGASFCFGSLSFPYWDEDWANLSRLEQCDLGLSPT